MNFYDYFRGLILPLNLIDALLPKSGKIVELGCGQGIISKFISKRKKRRIIGIDNDIKRLPIKNEVNLIFLKKDITKSNIPKANGYVLSDVLHHLKLSDQKKLIKKAHSSLRANGVLLIKEIDTKEFTRSKLSRLWDYLLYPKDQINYWNSKDLLDFLLAVGFRTKMLRTSRLFPGSTNLFIARKK